MNAIDFTDEAAVKDYIDRVGIEFRFQCFNEERSDGCHRLADWLEFAKKDYPKACRVYKSTCDLHGYGHSCFKFGNYAFLGRGLPEPQKKDAAEYYKKGCDAVEPYAGACLNYGTMIEKGDHKVEDPLEARRYFAKGCDLKDGPSCTSATSTCVRGEFKDFILAFQFASKGCEMEDYKSCANLSRMYERGDGVEKNAELAQQFKDKYETILGSFQEEKTNVTFGR